MADKKKKPAKPRPALKPKTKSSGCGKKSCSK